jgi:hypothetical protein
VTKNSVKTLYVTKNIKTRREFLKQATTAVGMLPLLKGDRQAFGALKSPFDPDAISKLKTGFGGRLIVPGDTEYETVRGALSMNPETDKYPALVAQCKNQEDVSRCVDFAHEQELEVAVRSGNHSFLGWGTYEKGIVIDLSRMKAVTVDPVPSKYSISLKAEWVTGAASP